MSFILQYHRLFRVLVQQAGSNTVLPGISFAPATSSQKVLTNHHLTFRPREGGFDLYYRMNPQAADPLLGRISQRVRFSFCLFLSEPDIFQRYEPDLTSDTGPQLYLDNLTPAGAIQPASKQTLTVGAVAQASDAMKVYPHIFFATADLGGGALPTKFTVRDKFNPATVVLEVSIHASAGVDQAVTKIDISGRPSGPYTLETDAAGSVPKTIYLDDELAGAQILGLLDIYWETAQDSAPAGGVPYFIRLQKR